MTDDILIPKVGDRVRVSYDFQPSIIARVVAPAPLSPEWLKVEQISDFETVQGPTFYALKDRCTVLERYEF